MPSKLPKIREMLATVQATIQQEFELIRNMHAAPIAEIVRGYLEPEILEIASNEYCTDQLDDEHQVLEFLINTTDGSSDSYDEEETLMMVKVDDSVFLYKQETLVASGIPDVVVEREYCPDDVDVYQAMCEGEDPPKSTYRSHTFYQVPMSNSLKTYFGENLIKVVDWQAVDYCEDSTYSDSVHEHEWRFPEWFRFTDGVPHGWAMCLCTTAMNVSADQEAWVCPNCGCTISTK